MGSPDHNDPFHIVSSALEASTLRFALPVAGGFEAVGASAELRDAKLPLWGGCLSIGVLRCGRLRVARDGARTLAIDAERVELEGVRAGSRTLDGSLSVDAVTDAVVSFDGLRVIGVRATLHGLAAHGFRVARTPARPAPASRDLPGAQLR